MARRLLTIAVALTALALAPPAWAHVSVSTPPAPVLAEFGPEAFRAGAPASAGPWLLVAGAAMAAALMLRSRRALALALLALLALGAFEAGVHSVHHLGQAEAVSCAVATLSSQLGGVAVDVVALEQPTDVVTSAAPAPAVAVALARLSAPDRGRAPPAA